MLVISYSRLSRPNGGVIRYFSKSYRGDVSGSASGRGGGRHGGHSRPEFDVVAGGERFGKYAMLTIPVVTFGLGTWQVYRRRWKLELIADLQALTTAEPISLPHDLDELDHMEYRKVRVTGTFDHSKEVYVRPRSRFIDGGESKPGGLISGAQSAGSGLHVVTPFKLTDRELTILVNRGWVGRKFAAPASRSAAQVEGEVELVGVVRRNERRAPFVPKNEAGSRFFHYRDVETMARLCDTDPIFLDADAESTIPGGPEGGQTRVTLRNEHLSYIITWYSLSAATLYIWFRRYVQKRVLV